MKDFKVLELLGKGGFACVYRGTCLATGQEVAIKMVRICDVSKQYQSVQVDYQLILINNQYNQH